jgi:hypothetical protein
MRGVAPEIAAAARHVGERHRANQAGLVAYLQEHRHLRNDLGPDEALDIVWALPSYDLYRGLVVEQRWPAERYQNWLAGILAATRLRH